MSVTRLLNIKSELFIGLVYCNVFLVLYDNIS